MRENCPYLELFWSAFSYIWTEYGEIRSIVLLLYSSLFQRENDSLHEIFGQTKMSK